MIYATTGHRPERLGGHSEQAWETLCNFAMEVIEDYKPKKVFVGMALGWDLAVASACVSLNVPYIAAIPFRGHESVWSKEKRMLYRILVTQADMYHIVSPGGYAAWKLLRRNEWMVDQASEVIALYDGSPGGGTFRCIQYAESKGKKVHNEWPRWIDGGKK